MFFKKACALIAVLAVAAGALTVSAAEYASSGGSASGGGSSAGVQRIVSTIAFKGAEGGGMYTQGARAALDNDEKIEVYHVTNLNDSGEGSFRDAVSKSNRIVVFDVSGYVDLDSNVTIGHDNITILGQTAPGGGICFRSNNIKIGADNVILRYIRFRVGAHDRNGNDTSAQDGLEITDNCRNVIIDHCSVSWGTDENLVAYAVKDVTIQNSIIAESLNQSVHDKGEHSYAAIWGGVNLTIHHNLIATHKSRNPKIGTSETVEMTEGYTDAQTLVDIHNNVFYNWGDKAGYGSENGAYTYIRNNIYRPGPATPAGKRARIFELSVGNKYQTNMLGSVYADGNIIDVEPSDSDYENARKVNENNYQDDLHTGVYVDNKYYDTADKTKAFMSEPEQAYYDYAADYPSDINDVSTVYDYVTANAGATLPKRDAVDTRIIDNVVNRTAPTGSKGSVGLLDDPTDIAGFDGRGYPELETVSREVSEYDSDADGIPDEWEDKMGLDKSNPTDSTKLGPDGYTWLEIYVEEAITNPVESDITVSLDCEDRVYRNGNYVVDIDADIAGTYENIELYCNERKVYCKQVGNQLKTMLPAGENMVTAKLLFNNGEEYVLSPVIYVSVKGTDFEPFTDASYASGIVQTPVGTVGTAVLAGYEDEVLKSIRTAEIDSETGQAIVGSVSEADWRIFIWDSLNGMKPVLTKPSQTEWIVRGGADYDGKEYTLPNNSSLTQNVSGDFKLVTKLGSMTSRYSGIETGLRCGDIKLYKTYDESYKEKLIYNGEEYTGIPADKVKYLEMARTGNTVSLYAGTSLADIESYKVGEAAVSGSVEAGAYVSGDKTTVSMLEMLKLSTEKSEPKAELELVEGQRLLLNGETVDVTVTADNSPITEVWLYLDGKPLTSVDGLYITGTETVSIPVTFITPENGTITAYCFDENLGRGEDSKSVAITQDVTPWTLTDIGADEDDAKSYVLGTNDYTYKIGDSSNGQIGGTADRFAFLNQQFTGNTRLYARLRLQNAKQMGFVLKNDLEPDSVTYYFGANMVDGAVKYQLTKRDTEGGDTEVIYDATADINDKDKAFIVFEKKDNMLNIYKSTNNGDLFKVNTLLTSLEITGIDDSYYMGFGAVSDGICVPDTGWLGIETVGDTSSSWTFDNGLDWLWQLQEANVLRPSWTSDDVAGNTTGMMKLTTDSDYSSGRYVFHEYVPGEGNKFVSAKADVLVSSEDAGINVYLTANSKDTGFKVSFETDGYIYVSGEKTEYTYDINKWYTVSATVDEGLDANKADVMVKEGGGRIAADITDADAVTIREQINTEKKTPVTNGIFFEPIAGKTGTYYIDNVSVDVTDSRIQKTPIGSHFWKFSDSEFDGLSSLANGSEYSGLNIVTGAAIESNNKTIDGVSFSKRYKMGGAGSRTSKCVYFDIPAGTTDIVVYGEPAGSSGTRSIIIDDGETHPTVVTTQTAIHYTHDGDAARVYVYGDSGVNLYGISYETFTITD